ncbi:MAG TPA: MFS transporter, partial [Ktedonobacterales bacterium]|nr:MFS transporter [Ktedonobacterales bacterium]
QMWSVALVLVVLQRFHSPTLAGLAAFLSVVPGLVVSPISGALLDRHGRLRLILLDFIVAAVSMLTLSALLVTDRLAPPVLLVVVGLGSLTGPLSMSGMRSLFPLVVPRGLWDRANGIDSGIFALSLVLGPALAGYLVGWVGGEGVFLVTAGVYVLAMLALIGLREPEASTTGPRPSLARSAWQALTYVVRNPSLRGIAATLFTGNISGGIISIALPVLVFGRFHGTPADVGALWMVSGLATVCAGLLAGRLNTEGRERFVVALGMGISALAAGALALVSVFAVSDAVFVVGGLALGAPLVLLAVTMLLFGIAGGPIDVGLFSLRQRRTDPQWFGRVFAVSMSLNFAGFPAGAALGGPLAERSVTLALLVGVAVSIASAVIPYLTIPREG